MTTATIRILPKVITANRLGDGRVVFLSRDGWSRLIEEAEVAMGTEEAEAALARANADAAANRVIGPYAVDVRLERGRPVPLRLRERIRLTGPTTGNSIAEAGPGAQAA
jgi:hypothetical protein